MDLPGCEAEFLRLYGVPVDSPTLTWRVPFRELYAGVQTVAEMAQLSGVTVRTIHRAEIPVGGFRALDYVLCRWRGTARPMVRHAEPLHRLNLRRALCAGGWPINLADVVEQCRRWHAGELKPKGGGIQVPGRLLGVEPSPAAEAWNRKAALKQASRPRKLKVGDGADRWATEADLARGEKFRASYRPKRATMAMLCALLQVKWRSFTYWRDNLLAAEKRVLALAMSGELFGAVETIADAPPDADAAADFDHDEIDRRLGWVEPGA
jgi:hypothetical protein